VVSDTKTCNGSGVPCPETSPTEVLGVSSRRNVTSVTQNVTSVCVTGPPVLNPSLAGAGELIL